MTKINISNLTTLKCQCPILKTNAMRLVEATKVQRSTTASIPCTMEILHDYIPGGP